MSTAAKEIEQNIIDLTPMVNAAGKTSDDRIAEMAYYKAEKRGFEPGHEMDDWLTAEQEYHLIYHI